MTTPLDPLSGAAPVRPGAAPATPGGALGKDAFMQLLVAQMRYQNPLSPVDGQQYMAQLAQFAQVEKLEAISQAQSDAAAWQRTVAGQAMLGRQVTGTGTDGTAVTGTVTSVELTPGGPRLQLAGGGSLPVAAVTSVTAPAPERPAP